jgi:peptidoglycan L-alanyl-D-glutamate endopeptidase CwlK
MTLQTATRRSTAELREEVARARQVDPRQVTNQHVVNYLLNGGTKTFAQAGAAARAYGLDLNDLIKHRTARFEGPDAPAAPSRSEIALDEISAPVAALTRQLPPGLASLIAANVVDIRNKAQATYEQAIAAGSTEEEALKKRVAFAENEIVIRVPLLDASIQGLNLPPSAHALWASIKKDVSKPGLYARALAAEVAFRENATLGPRESDEVYGKPVPLPANRTYPATLSLTAKLTTLETNYLQSLKADPKFAQRILGAAGFYQGPVNGVWNAEVTAAFRQQVAAYRATRQTLGELDPKSESVIITLLPKAQAAARRTILAINAQSRQSGVTARLLWGTRTYAQQNALFAQRPKVTNARGGFSNHNFGMAFDIGLFENGRYVTTPPAYKKAHAHVDMTGMEWGGDWTSFQDTPHYEMTVGGRSPNVTELRELFEQGRPIQLG